MSAFVASIGTFPRKTVVAFDAGSMDVRGGGEGTEKEYRDERDGYTIGMLEKKPGNERNKNRAQKIRTNRGGNGDREDVNTRKGNTNNGNYDNSCFDRINRKAGNQKRVNVSMNILTPSPDSASKSRPISSMSSSHCSSRNSVSA